MKSRATEAAGKQYDQIASVYDFIEGMVEGSHCSK